MGKAPEIIEVDNQQLEAILLRVEQAGVTAEDVKLIRAVCESYAYVSALLDDKNTSIRRLRQLFFGSASEKTKAVLERNSAKPEPTAGEDATATTELTTAPPATVKPAATAPAVHPPGHGRNGADDYRGAQRIEVPHQSLAAGRPLSGVR